MLKTSDRVDGCQELRQAGVAAWNRLFDEEELDLILIPGFLCLGLNKFGDLGGNWEDRKRLNADLAEDG